MILALALTPGAFAGLTEYVERQDESFRYEVVETQTINENTVEMVRLTSQTWQGIVWKHWLVIIKPPVVDVSNRALLLVGGGRTSENIPSAGGTEARVMNMIAKSTKSVVAGIMQVPNQPLFDGRSEDGIIAYTYDKYLQGGGEDWPLLFPMVKSAVRAMDAVQAVMKEKHGQDIKEFMLTGGSKRGWTSWLTAASGDPRVKCIAPVVIDVLNMHPQMQKQMAVYGGYSEQVQDYTDLKIQERMDTPEGRELLGMVDPYAYRHRLSLPKLIMLGTNDPYWTVDAASLYFPGLVGEKHLYYQANTGHDVNLDGISTLTEFYSCFLNDGAFPQITWKRDGKGHIEAGWERDGGKANLWQAFSPNRDFRPSAWSSRPLKGVNRAEADVAVPGEGWTAFYVEVKFPGSNGLQFGSCTEMTVLPDRFPTEGRAFDVDS